MAVGFSRELSLREENERLRAALGAVRMHSLLQVRRAAFAPEIGVKYTEAIRADICNEIWRLEQFIDAAL